MGGQTSKVPTSPWSPGSPASPGVRKIPINQDDVEMIKNPPDEIYNQLVHYSAISCARDMRLGDYVMWRETTDCTFFVVVLKKNQEFVASIMMIKYMGLDGEPFYQAGLYYCRPEFRGSQVALGLSEYALGMVPPNSNMGGHGVLKLYKKYAAKQGFKEFTEYREYRTYVYFKDVKIPELSISDVQIKNVEDVAMDDLIKYDRTILPLDRAKYFEKFLLEKDGSYAKVAIDANNNIIGIGCIKEVTTKELVAGPFYADTKDAATALLHSILSSIPNLASHPRLLLRTPNSNPHFLEWLKTFTTAPVNAELFWQPQYTKKVLNIDDKRVYSIMQPTNNMI